MGLANDDRSSCAEAGDDQGVFRLRRVVRAGSKARHRTRDIEFLLDSNGNAVEGAALRGVKLVERCRIPQGVFREDLAEGVDVAIPFLDAVEGGAHPLNRRTLRYPGAPLVHVELVPRGVPGVFAPDAGVVSLR